MSNKLETDEHMTMREQLKDVPWWAKFLTYAGCLKPIPKYIRDHKTGKWMYGEKIRILHPFMWIYLIIFLFIHGFNRDSFSEIKGASVWW